jgi:hypothetical protein
VGSAASVFEAKLESGFCTSAIAPETEAVPEPCPKNLCIVGLQLIDSMASI